LLITLFHLVVLCIHSYSIFFNFLYVEIGSEGLGGKFKYLTIWNFCLHTLYYGISFVKDLTEGESDIESWNPRKSKLHKWRDFFHAAIFVPFGFFVFVSFWTLMAIDRELVFPKSIDHLYPKWLNHTMHTTILPFMLIEKFLIYHEYPKRKNGLLAAGGLGLFYILWTFFVAYYDNFWIYPVLKVLGTWERAAFIVICSIFAIIFYIIGEYLTKWIWGRRLPSSGLGLRKSA